MLIFSQIFLVLNLRKQKFTNPSILGLDFITQPGQQAPVGRLRG